MQTRCHRSGRVAWGLQSPFCMKPPNRPRLKEQTDHRQAAKQARLLYVQDTEPGIARVRAGSGFRYIGPDGQTIRHRETLLRIRSLAIPPAWTQVWICRKPRGHLQATGRDAKGRKQHRYHPQWRSVRDSSKYDRLIAFGQALPRLRTRVERDFRRPGLSREKVLAVVVKLLETTWMRVGNEEYARANGSFGLTTLRDRHAQIGSGSVHLRFWGKSGVWHEVGVLDRRMARVVKNCQDLPGQRLFQYEDDRGKPRSIDSADVNAYLRAVSGADFTAKDFRTWAGSLLAASALAGQGPWKNETEARQQVVQAVRFVAERLGNTVAVCRKCYIHPAILETHLRGHFPNRSGARLWHRNAAPHNDFPRTKQLC